MQTFKKHLLNDQWHIFTNIIYGDLVCTLHLYFPPGSVPIHKQMLHYFSLSLAIKDYINLINLTYLRQLSQFCAHSKASLNSAKISGHLVSLHIKQVQSQHIQI